MSSYLYRHHISDVYFYDGHHIILYDKDFNILEYVDQDIITFIDDYINMYKYNVGFDFSKLLEVRKVVMRERIINNIIYE